MDMAIPFERELERNSKTKFELEADKAKTKAMTMKAELEKQAEAEAKKDENEDDEDDDVERRKPTLRAIANTLKKLLTYFPPSGSGAASSTPVTELQDTFLERHKSSWRHRASSKKAHQNSTLSLRNNLKSGLPASARSSSTSLFSRTSAFNNMIHGDNSSSNGNLNNNLGGGKGFGKNGRPSLSLTTSFDYSSETLQLPGRFVEKETNKEWSRMSSIDC